MVVPSSTERTWQMETCTEPILPSNPNTEALHNEILRHVPHSRKRGSSAEDEQMKAIRIRQIKKEFLQIEEKLKATPEKRPKLEEAGAEMDKIQFPSGIVIKELPQRRTGLDKGGVNGLANGLINGLAHGGGNGITNEGDNGMTNGGSTGCTITGTTSGEMTSQPPGENQRIKKIQKTCLGNGTQHIQMEDKNLQESWCELSEEKKMKRQRRKEMNRKSANQSRINQQRYEQSLKKDISSTVEAIYVLKMEIEKIRSENQVLRMLVARSSST